MTKDLYALVKPGIVYGNALTAAAGFLFASRGHADVRLFLAMLAGLSLIIAGSCVVNNYLDRDIDARMERTKDRALAVGRIAAPRALLFALVLLASGVAVLFFYTNPLTLSIALLGVVLYLALYTPLKRVSEHAVLIGALAGATPPVIGYTAVTHSLDTIALLLFIILVAWQMVHFSAIAIYRIEEYRAAGIPVFPIRQGARSTKALMTAHALIFLLGVTTLTLIGHLGVSYLLGMGALSMGWVALCVWGFRARRERAWARAAFYYSLVILVAFCLFLAVG